MPNIKTSTSSEDEPIQHFSKGGTRDELPMPRPHHYLFAHRMVPTMFFTDPVKFMGALRNNGENLLYFLWGRIGQDMKVEDRLLPEGLGCKLIKLDDGLQVGVVSMPKPKGMTEAFMTAVVYQAAEGEREERQRYFTLEKGMTLSGKMGTVLGEWEGVKNHLNYGDGPKPEVEAFVEAIRRKISRA